MYHQMICMMSSKMNPIFGLWVKFCMSEKVSELVRRVDGQSDCIDSSSCIKNIVSVYK